MINLVVTAAAACTPNAKRDGEHQVIMLADACAVLCATGRADASVSSPAKRSLPLPSNASSPLTKMPLETCQRRVVPNPFAGVLLR